MFDVSFPELIVIGAIALVVLGPERLPTAARTAGMWLGKIKRTVSNVQQEITSQLEAEELQRKMKSQQDRFDQGLKKAKSDIESLGDDASGSSKKLSDSALKANTARHGMSATSQSETDAPSLSSPTTPDSASSAPLSEVTGTPDEDRLSASGEHTSLSSEASADRDRSDR